ncbi:MAG TPA: pyridoxine 5'-phosphate synthase [Candidatus Hydrogenedentes bacterium]|nr:pyridoxine 5'-phosphate synthase [Candidatus Hydrogenedentota bacterium]HIJ73703.1 pyridoxine 5'-phosphate synthase [Candidatus Hydrogenedentota bacterium]
MIELGVNIDHVATLREARKGNAPDVLEAARACERAGAHQITVHLRQDRRHIQDRDVETLAEVLDVRLNLEMAAVDAIAAIAKRIKPHTVCLVPENRQEITTEGGLDVAGDQDRLADVVAGFRAEDIRVSMFIDPERAQVDASAAINADYVELHTGAYANAAGDAAAREIERLSAAAAHAIDCGLGFHAGHGLTVRNLRPVARIRGLQEVNIGHDIIARALFIGLENAVKGILDVLGECSR